MLMSLFYYYYLIPCLASELLAGDRQQQRPQQTVAGSLGDKCPLAAVAPVSSAFDREMRAGRWGSVPHFGIEGGGLME